MLLTIPAHPNVKMIDGAGDGVGDEAKDGVKSLIFKTLGDVRTYCDGATDGAIDGAHDDVEKILNNELHDKVIGLLEGAEDWINRVDLFKHVSLTSNSTNRKKYLDPLMDIGWIEMEYPDTPTHPNQRYKITASGTKLKQLIEGK